MPKHVIYSDQSEFVREDGNEWPIDSLEATSLLKVPGQQILRRGIHLGWTKDMFVELGVAEFALSSGDPIPGSGMFLSLDRPGINRLVNGLRQARNSAFGKDA